MQDSSREKARQAIALVEGQTSAELVVSVSRCSGHYRHADYLFGFVLLILVLAFYLFYPEPFMDDIAAVLLLASFVIGSAFCSAFAPLRRLLVRSAVKNQAVTRAAKSAFVDQGISRTRARTGILVFVSLFERRAEIVPDIGVPVDRMGDDWKKAVEAIQNSVKKGANFDDFVAQLSRLTPVLSRCLPREIDDQNELSDEVVEQ